jgi:C4-dicarboxylate-binding protein DctP
MLQKTNYKSKKEDLMFPKSLSKPLKAVCVAAAVALTSGVAMAQTTIIMSNDNNSKGLKGQTFEILKRELEAKLGDKVKVELHHSGSLFDQKTQVQGLQLGSVNIISPTPGIYASVAKKINVLLLPFLLSSPEAINAAMNDEVVRKAFIPDLESKNITPIAVWMNGPRSVGHKGKTPALTPDQWKGKKIRVQSAPIFVKTMEAIKANVIAMSWSEVPTALQTGVIDAAEPTPNAWKGSGIYQLVDHIIRNEYVYSFYIVGANKNWWNGLSADVKKGVQDALAVATKWNWQNETKINNASLEFMASKGTQIHKLTPEQRKLWQQAVAPVWTELGNNVVGDEVMKRLKEIAAKYPPK